MLLDFQIVDRLAQLRQDLEGGHVDAGLGGVLPVDTYLLLGDVCTCLGLDRFQEAVVIGPIGLTRVGSIERDFRSVVCCGGQAH